LGELVYSTFILHSVFIDKMRQATNAHHTVRDARAWNGAYNYVKPFKPNTNE